MAATYDLKSLVADEEEEPPRLSFCDLPISGSSNPDPIAQPDHLFEFFLPPPSRDVTLFGGKFINIEKEEEHDQLNEYQKSRDYFGATKSRSFRKTSFSDHAAAEKRRLSASTRVSGDAMQRVNFSSLTSMSAKSRRRMFMFGPVKFRPEMELSAIKQRLAARPPAPAKATPAPSGGGGKSGWGLVKSSLRGRSTLTTVLTRSLGIFRRRREVGLITGKVIGGVSCLN